MLCKQPDIDKPRMGFRSARIFYLSRLAQRLASPLYGNMISVADAKRIIAGAA